MWSIEPRRDLLLTQQHGVYSVPEDALIQRKTVSFVDGFYLACLSVGLSGSFCGFFALHSS